MLSVPVVPKRDTNGAAERIEEVRSLKEQHLALNVREIARYCISKIQIAIFLFPGMNLQILIGT